MRVRDILQVAVQALPVETREASQKGRHQYCFFNELRPSYTSIHDLQSRVVTCTILEKSWHPLRVRDLLRKQHVQ